MAKNLARIANYSANIESWKDYDYVACKAIAAGGQAIVTANTPAPEAGWRTIDKCTAAIRAEFGWPFVYEMRNLELAGTK